MIPTFVLGWPTGQEEGNFLAVDLGKSSTVHAKRYSTSISSQIIKVEQTYVFVSSVSKVEENSKSHSPNTVFLKNRKQKTASCCLTFVLNA